LNLWDEVTAGWRKLHSEELHDLFSTSSLPICCGNSTTSLPNALPFIQSTFTGKKSGYFQGNFRVDIAVFLSARSAFRVSRSLLQLRV
jgi:hypothetical protein